LCEQLLKQGAEVYVYDRESPSRSYLALMGLADRIDYIPGDIRDLDLLKSTLGRFEIGTVFHLAAQPIVPLCNACPYESLSVNVLGTYTVLEAVRTCGAHPALVFASSGAYYGTTFEKEAIAEDHPPMSAANIYAPSKLAGDVAVRAYARTYGIKAAVCRFINTYGPGNRNMSTIVPKTIMTLLKNEPFDFGDRDDGTSTFDYLNVRDMTRGYLAVGENIERVSGEAFNFGGGHPISVDALVRLISRLYDGKEREPLFHGAKKEIPVHKRLNTAKAREWLGWEPSISLEDGLKETIAWYRAHSKNL
jgi:CDP-glucose 4,6-dehydratase